GTIHTIGTIGLANVPNPQGLNQEGNSYFKAVSNTGTVAYGAPSSGTVGSLVTSALETSNVDLANEFAQMITTQRGFQANSRIITVGDEMLETLINMKR
ncbi:MAG: flagellar hook-basal body complex protein, partial [Clostridia bacterium]|nr:flagellar hook-basal body complex protein [Clostridia bacterium]